jgi:hypothetical protein
MGIVGLVSVFQLIRLQWMTPENLDSASVEAFEEWKKHYKRSLLLFVACGLGMFVCLFFIRLLIPSFAANPVSLFGSFGIILVGCVFGVLDGSKAARLKKSIGGLKLEATKGDKTQSQSESGLIYATIGQRLGAFSIDLIVVLFLNEFCKV